MKSILPVYTSLLLGAVLTFLALPLPAQQPDTVRADTVYTVEGVVVTGKRRIVTTGGASAVVVLPDSLSLRPVSTMEDALRELPFVLVRQNSRGMAEISVRGSESRQVAVLLDGVPLTLAWDHRTDPAVIPLMGVQSLSLVRGLPSVLNGPNVLGGVVEVDVGRGADLLDAHDELRATAGLDDAGYRAVGASARMVREMVSGRFIARGGAGFRTRDGFALPAGLADAGDRAGRRTNSDVEEWTGFGALRWQDAGDRWVSLSASGYRAERGVPPELHLATPRLWRYPEEWQAVAAFSAGTGHQRTWWGEGDLEAAIGINVGQQDIEAFRSLAYDEVVATESGDDRTLTLRLLGDHTLGSRGELRAAATYADINHTEILGAAERNEYRQRLWSLGSEVAWRLPASTRLSTGVALDGADTPESGGKPPLGTLTAWGARLGMSTLALHPDLQLHASLSSRARFPALRELYSGALGRFEPNPGLVPERLNAAEVGATLRRPGVEIQATLFQHLLTDAVVRISTPERKFRRINRDEIRSSGVEMLLGATLGGAELQGDLMLQSVRVNDPASGTGPVRPEHMPEFRAGLDLEVPLPLALRGMASVQHTGKQFCVHPDLGRDVDLEASTRFDAGMRRSWNLGGGFWRAIRATAALDNLADAAVFDQCGMPQPGRTFRLGIEIF
jgi:iron complex outermembrane receptor protein